MEITSPTAPGAGQTPAAAKGTEISSDFETFLKMLTVQMQNQDPLNPIESSDYAVQLATFSGVEQQVQTNDLLRDLVAQMGAGGMAQMASWVDMDVRSATPVSFAGSPISLEVKTATNADSAWLEVFDDQDRMVQSLPLTPGETSVEWAGVTEDGSPLAPGTYRFEVVSTALGQEIGRTPAATYGRVTEVLSENGVTSLKLADGSTVAATAVTAVRRPH